MAHLQYHLLQIYNLACPPLVLKFPDFPHKSANPDLQFDN